MPPNSLMSMTRRGGEPRLANLMTAVSNSEHAVLHGMVPDLIKNIYFIGLFASLSTNGFLSAGFPLSGGI